MLKNTYEIYTVLKYAIKYAWKRYHFLIPPKQLYKGIAKVIKKIKFYKSWIKKNEKIPQYKQFEYNPLISILIPHYNTEPQYLKECIESVLNQSYKNFEICIADDFSNNRESVELLKKYEQEYSQIKLVWRKENGGISAATNSAIDIANGEFIAFVDSDDTLSQDALYWNVEALNGNKNLDLLYSDEDKLDLEGNRTFPHFKCGWNSELLLAVNYITHFVLARTNLVKELGGCRSEFDGAQDHDFLLRLTEKTNNIYHIAKILYHWRMIPGGTAVFESEKPCAAIARKKAVKEALVRRNLQGQLIQTESNFYFYNVLFKNSNEKVSILIPTHDHINYLKVCLESMYEKTTYKNFEIIIIDHNSQKRKSLEYFEECKKKYNNLKVIRRECEFNHSYLNNEAAKVATGDYLVFLNSDTKIITPQWLEYMLGYARQESTGCVGAKLLYPDNTIQHAGVALDGNEIGVHSLAGIDEFTANRQYRCIVASEYSAVTFACAMVSKEKFDMINGLNEELPADYNDVDFCLEMLKLGYKNVFLPMVKLYHYEGKIRGNMNTSNSNYNRWVEAKKYMKNKWGDLLEQDKLASPYLF